MLNAKESSLHEAAVKCANQLARGQNYFIRILIEVERSRFYRKINRRNLLEYIRDELRVDSSYIYELARVTEKAIEFPLLADALISNRMNSSHAGRIISALDSENVSELVEFACTHSFRQVSEFMAKRNPERRTRESGKWLSENQYRVSIVMSREEYEIMKGVQDIEAQCQRPAKMKDALIASLREYHERHDKFKKAERAAHRKDQPKKGKLLQKSTVRKVTLSKRIPFTAAQKHAVHLGAGSQCCFQDHRGRCEARRHLHIHHKVPVQHGGSNDPDNLVLVCSYHHDLIHQLTFPGLKNEYSFAGAAERVA